MATLLDDRLVADAMTNLDQWSGDAQRISRTVRVPDADALLAAVAEAADTLDHHPVVEREGDGVTFVLWTHSLGGVTELDIALASRIDDLVVAVGGGHEDSTGPVRSTVGAPSEEGAVAGRTVTAQPNFPTPGQTTPSRPEESATGATTAADAAADSPALNEPAAPRQDAGSIAAPDAAMGSMEPQPGNAAAPGMHERVDSAEAEGA
jgi:4a-hydroxytetrahydrobiopterin dehydratase